MSGTLVNMKRERGESSNLMASPDQSPYPYGLAVILDHETLEKLGLKTPEVGAELLLVARVEVTSVSSHESSESEPSRSVTLQITDLCVEKTAGKAADALYGED